jgi:tetratricopeptide (TPR) repeat protein
MADLNTWRKAFRHPLTNAALSDETLTLLSARFSYTPEEAAIIAEPIEVLQQLWEAAKHIFSEPNSLSPEDAIALLMTAGTFYVFADHLTIGEREDFAPKLTHTMDTADYRKALKQQEKIVSEMTIIIKSFNLLKLPHAHGMALAANLMVCRARIYNNYPSTCNAACQEAMKATKAANNVLGADAFRMTIWYYSGMSFASSNPAQAIKCYKKAIALAHVGPDGPRFRDRWLYIASESKKDEFASLQPLLLAKFERMLADGEPEQILKLPNMAWGICASAEHVYTQYDSFEGRGFGLLAKELKLLPERAEEKLIALADGIPDCKSRYYYLQELLLRMQLLGHAEYYHVYRYTSWDNTLAIFIGHYACRIPGLIDESEFCSVVFSNKTRDLSTFKWAQAELDKHGYDTTPTRMQALFNRLNKNDVRGKKGKNVLKKLLG